MPAVSALAEGVPELVSRVLLPKLFSGLGKANGEWAFFEGDTRVSVAGFKLVRGSFDPDFPAREVAVWVGQQEPPKWPEDVDLCLGFVCEVATDGSVQPGASITNLEGTPRVILTMPTLVPFDGQVPRKSLATTSTSNRNRFVRRMSCLTSVKLQAASRANPRPIMPATARPGNSLIAQAAPRRPRCESSPRFETSASTTSMSYLIHGEVDAGMGGPYVTGPELIRRSSPSLVKASVTQATRHSSPAPIGSRWSKHIERDWQADISTLASGVGKKEVMMTKADAFRLLFNQTSTAAGDSFIRSLGPLANVTAASDSWSIRFSLHPGEAASLSTSGGATETAGSDRRRRLRVSQA